MKSGLGGAGDRLSGQLRLELLDRPNADAMELRKLDDAYALPEIGDNGGSLVGWNGRAAEPNPGSTGTSLPGENALGATTPC